MILFFLCITVGGHQFKKKIGSGSIKKLGCGRGRLLLWNIAFNKIYLYCAKTIISNSGGFWSCWAKFPDSSCPSDDECGEGRRLLLRLPLQQGHQGHHLGTTDQGGPGSLESRLADPDHGGNQCSGMIYSGSSFEFSEFRIQAKVPVPDPDPICIN